MKVLLDHSVPRGLRAFLTGFEIKHAFEMGWHELRNGDLLNEAERSGFAVLITADRNLRYQNRLANRQIAILELGTNHWPTIERHGAVIRSALERLPVAGYGQVQMPKPPRHRRLQEPGNS